MTGAQKIRGLYQIGLTRAQLMDLFENCDSFKVSITCVPDLLDADVQLLELGALATIGGYFGAAMLLDYGAAWLGFLQNAIAVTGSTRRQACPQSNYATASAKNPAGLPYPICRDLCFQHEFTSMTSQFLILIDFGATVRQLVGQKNNASDWLYYPAISLIGVLGGYALATDVMLLQGAGVVTGGITLNDRNGGTIGIISIVNALTGNGGPPIGTPSLIGSIQPQSLYDALKWARDPGGLKLSGVPFAGIPKISPLPNVGVFFGAQQSPGITLNTDGSIVAQVPAGFTRDFITFRSSGPQGNVWSSRIPVEVA